jgi:hypothetical protein
MNVPVLQRGRRLGIALGGVCVRGQCERGGGFGGVSGLAGGATTLVFVGGGAGGRSCAGLTAGGGLDFAVDGLDFAAESPNTTKPFAGRLRTAVAQSVGAACLLAGTLTSQIRHMPGGGRCADGTVSPGRARACAASGTAAISDHATASEKTRRIHIPRMKGGRMKAKGRREPSCFRLSVPRSEAAGHR